MLVFSRWGYNHYKLVANDLGASSQGYKRKKKPAAEEIKKKSWKQHQKSKKDNKTQNKILHPWLHLVK